MKKWTNLFLFSSVLFSVGCSSLPEVDSTPAKDIKPVQAEQQNNLVNIKKQIKGGKPEDNIELITRERTAFKGTEVEPELELLLAQEYTKIGKHSDAGLAFLRSARSTSGNDRRLKLCQQAGRSFQTGKDWDRLKRGADYCLTNFEISTEGVRELKTFKVMALEEEGASPLDVSKGYVDLMANSSGESEAKFRSKALQLIETMSRNQLDAVVGDSDFGFLRGHASYRLAQIYLSQRENEAAKSSFIRVAQFLPETELAEISQGKYSN